MWVDVLNKPKQGKVFKEFIGEVINVEIDYDYEVERKNTSDRIVGVIPEKSNGLNMVKIEYHTVRQYIQEVGRRMQYLPILHMGVLSNHRKQQQDSQTMTGTMDTVNVYPGL